MISLFRQIIYHDPPIQVLNMEEFSRYNESDGKNVGETILESLLSSNIDSITDINLGCNRTWFNKSGSHGTLLEICSNVNLVSELISKQAGIHHINLRYNLFTSNATKTIVTKIADHTSTISKL